MLAWLASPSCLGDPGAASSNWLEWRITRTFDSFWRLFEKKPRHFYGQNHFMSKIIVSTCAGTNWTDLNVEVSARPWPNIPIWNFIQMWGVASNDSTLIQRTLAVDPAQPVPIGYPGLWRSHSKETCTFETFWFGTPRGVFFWGGLFRGKNTFFFFQGRLLLLWIWIQILRCAFLRPCSFTSQLVGGRIT